ncbi:hypothetical protein [Paractinoplanes globisporus]|uniref:Uncharacterized protein n=1 Tax=Paractinoplanes globisporus TaxID=113565 RepID=A0ABW6W8A8_9ACTN|nr:hypothetical protein [Actinoplanes globisporus]
MDYSRLPEPLRKRVEELAAEPPLDTVRLFLGTEFGDSDSFAQVRGRFERQAQYNIRSHQRDLWALEAVIANPPAEPGALSHIVAWDANWVLDDASDAAALEFLREIAQLLREVIDAAPATAERWDEWPPRSVK